NERLAQSDQSLVSPALVVSRTRPLRISFRHRHWFDTAQDTNSNTVNLDGGVVEISTDNGQTWNDIGFAASPGYGTTPILNNNRNPLEGRRAFVGLSTGTTYETPSASPFAACVIDLGYNYAGQTVRIRFRMGVALGHSGLPLLGWQIDDVSISGINNLPFPALVSDTGLCGRVDTTITLDSQWQATVTSSLNVIKPIGTVELLDGGAVLAAAPLINGVAIFDKALLIPGSHALTASFVGTSNFNPSASNAVTINVPAPPHRRAAR